ncbi:catalase [Pseudoalteromonas sp. MMG010]|uniref:putative metalloprotease CJM1_0395 family protein n=1 Tax=Pseudoalteromonas sp. MMG010 TaxID=2822685 RepID=UPI001B3A0431|nr:putative metalloprotease CJM1_0395 family protein [Pseudoalteromonas sp. MMG010]MBQ4834337.1 catalase [Pseudoalteromonas sp. MMG010]
MNIVTPTPTINLSTANVQTESARRDNQLREVIPAPVATTASNSDNKALSDTDKARVLGDSEGTTYDATGKLSDDQAVQAQEEQQDDATEQEQQEKADIAEQEEQVLAQEQEEISELKARDTEVRIHEQAHASVGGQYAGSPSYGYERGPDGNNYAVSGEVQIDVSEIPGDPQATIDKMQTVRSAALAPAEPSSADRSIAADATQKMAAAQAELTLPDDEEKTDDSQDTVSASETSTAKAENEPDTDQTRDQEINERADRIANFYQMTSSPQSESGFSAFG